MAYQYLTMLDLTMFNNDDRIAPLIEENLNTAPEVRLIPATTIPGVSFTTLIRTDFPKPDFRAVNEGVEPKKSTYANKIVECFYLDGQLEIDNAAAGADERGVGHAQELEASGMVQGAMLKIGTQLWYGTGTGGDAKGFPGANQVVDPLLVKDATGTTAGTGSSVYGLKLGDKFVRFVFGHGNVFSMGEWRMQTITRNAKELTAWKNSLEGWIGVQWVNKWSVGRIKNLTGDANKGLTDVLIAQWLAQFPVGMRPDALFMSRRSAAQLQASRTVTIFVDAASRQSGQQARAAMPIAALDPIESNGIPVVVTDSLLDTETLG